MLVALQPEPPKDLLAQSNEFRVYAVLGLVSRYRNNVQKAAKITLHDQDPITKKYRFVDVISDEYGCEPFVLDDSTQLEIEASTCERIEGAEWLIQKQNLRLVDERPRIATRCDMPPEN